MKKLIITATSVLVLGLSTSSYAGGDIAAGKAKSSMCVACHGAEGKAMVPTYPNLAGQNEQYIISAIKAYKNKNRTGGQAQIMQAQAATLGDRDIENVAAYFSSLK